MRVQNRLAEVRRMRGLSAAELASRAGVNRQTVYAIEARKFIPNTLVALRLSQVLEVAVEDLFAVEPTPQPDTTKAIDLLTESGACSRPDVPVRLCRIGKKTIGVPSPPVVGELPRADATVLGPAKGGKTLVRTIPGEAPSKGEMLVAAGCDPAMPVLSRYLGRRAGVDLITPCCSSTRALTWLKDKRVHIAGTHLRSEARGGSALDIIGKFLSPGSFRVVTFASWEEGLVVAAGSPKGIRGVADLVRPDVAVINREVGSGSRFLLDSSLKRAGIPAARVRGYDQVTGGHIMAAWHVHTGKADCCIATRAAARVFGLAFIPLVSERYDLVIPLQYWPTPQVQATLDALNHASFRSELEALGGYDTTQTGRLVT